MCIPDSVTAIAMAFALIGTSSAISEIFPDSNSDCAVVHAANDNSDENSGEKKQTLRITYVIKRVAAYVKVDCEIRKAIQSNSSSKQYH